MNALTLTPGSLTLKQLRHVWRQPVTLSLMKAPTVPLTTAWPAWRRLWRRGAPPTASIPGLPAGADPHRHARSGEFTAFAGAVARGGVGQPLDDEIVRLMMVLKINSLARGFSGIRLSVIQALMALVNAEVYPWIPAKGSVGASGDLAPLAHMSLLLLGEGQARWQGEWLPAKEALKKLA